MIRIVLADDHVIVRAGFRALIEQESDLQIAAECGAADTAGELVRELRPDVLVLDLALPGGGLALLARLQESDPKQVVLVLSMHDKLPYVTEALQRGAAGYVTKAAASDELVAAMRAVAAGQRYLSSDLAKLTSATPPLAELTARGRDVFWRLASGQTPKQISIDLGISKQSVYVYRAALWAKFHVNSDLALHRRAVELGLISPYI